MLLSSAEKLSDFNALSRTGGAILTFEQVFSKALNLLDKSRCVHAVAVERGEGQGEGFSPPKVTASVNTAKAQPRSGSGVFATWSGISRNWSLCDGVNSSESIGAAKRLMIFLGRCDLLHIGPARVALTWPQCSISLHWHRPAPTPHQEEASHAGLPIRQASADE
jgi:hypothetical protein